MAVARCVARRIVGRRPKPSEVSFRGYSSAAAPTAALNFRDPAVFKSKSTKDLIFNYAILRACTMSLLTDGGPKMLEIMDKMNVGAPAYWFIKKTFYRHFCAGETLEESMKTVEELAKHNIKSILDYSVESASKIDDVVDVLVKAINISATSPSAKYSCYKMSGLTSHSLLERMNNLLAYKEANPSFELPWLALLEAKNYKEFVPQLKTAGAARLAAPAGAPPHLNEAELDELHRLLLRLELLADAAKAGNVPLLVDAEQSWFQKTIRFLTVAQMRRYNRERPVIYNTYQHYLKETLPILQADIAAAEKEKFFFGAKLVRGAYMHAESVWAQQHNTANPVNDSLQATHDSYNAGASLMLKTTAKSGAGLVIASHNEDTMLAMAKEMLNVGLKPQDELVDFATLYGMSDHASLALAQQGYNVCKYIPFGPVHDVMPYLMRRMQENRGFVGRTAEERQLMLSEIRKRIGM